MYVIVIVIVLSTGTQPETSVLGVAVNTVVILVIPLKARSHCNHFTILRLYCDYYLAGIPHADATQVAIMPEGCQPEESSRPQAKHDIHIFNYLKMFLIMIRA